MYYLASSFQRCLVHIKRQVKAFLSANPKTTIAKELLQFSNQITSIKSKLINATYGLLLLRNGTISIKAISMKKR